MSLPERWSEAELGQLAKFRNGVNYTKANFGTGIRVINVKDFQNYSTPHYEELDEINPESVVRPAHHLKENDVVFVRSNGNKELIGRSMVLMLVPDVPITHSAFTIRARFTTDAAYPRYYSYVFRSGLIRQVLSAHGSGTNISNLNQDILSRLRVPLPPLPTQRRIAAVLSAYDDLIENNTRRIAILEEMARRIFEEWFVHLRFPGHEGVRMIDSEIGPVPEGWVSTKLGDLAVEIRHAVYPSTVPPETPYVGLEHIPRRSITLSQWAEPRSVESTKLKFCRGDILFGKIRPYFHKVVVAPFDGICSSDTIVIRPAERRWLPLVLSCTSSDRFVDHSTQTSQGTKMPRANWKVLAQYPLPTPPAQVLQAFNSFVDVVIDQTRNLMLKNANLRAQRDLLLPRLISGEIDVSEEREPLTEAAAE